MLCKSCNQPFTITDADRQFYNKIGVPEPTLCPACRQQRKLAFRNERTFYQRQCDLYSKPIISAYHPQVKFPVYCRDCWWSDKWDARTYGRDWDKNRSFFEQWRELFEITPKCALLAQDTINSDYVVHSGNDKNCYLCGVTFYCEDCFYSGWIFNSKDIVDSYMIYRNCELCYQCLWCFQCFNCIKAISCHNSHNLNFCFDCHGCNDCFMSFNLRNQRYAFRGEKLSEAEYTERIKNINFSSYEEFRALEEEFKRKKLQAIHKYVEVNKTINSTGDYLLNTKNCHNCFHVIGGEDLFNCWGCETVKDCRDCYGFGQPVGSELLYEIQGVGQGYNTYFTNMTYSVTDCQYMSHSHNVKDCFGCSALKALRYCILNKQYTPEEYNTLKNQIIKKMTQDKEYGEFFPPHFSPFGYNETEAFSYFPLTKEEVIKWGGNWRDEVYLTKGKETIKFLPDRITDVLDSIVNDVLACVGCQRNYRIIIPELNYYRRQGLPLPRYCSSCRYLDRLNLCNPRKLYHRQCMRPSCSNEFETTYAPDRPEKIYCEECYRKEIY